MRPAATQRAYESELVVQVGLDQLDAEDIARAVDDVLRAQDAWAARGLVRAQLFTWDACARAHEVVYRELSSR